jgi:Cu+-exporting ATPase
MAQSKQFKLSISGMHCASCATLIQRELKKQSGVMDATVNFATEKAIVTVKSDISSSSLVKTVQKTGYDAVDSDSVSTDSLLERQAKEEKLRKRRLIISSILSIPLLYSMVGMLFPVISFPQLFQYIPLISFILASIVQFYGGNPFYRGFFAALKIHTFTMESLIAIGTTAAYFYSVVNLIVYYFQFGTFIPPAGTTIPNLYFETSALLITFVLLGKYLEARTKRKASDAITKLANLTPQTVNLMTKNSIMTIPVSEVQNNDVLLVKPGERIPLDGLILSGSPSIDESMLTGESLPVNKTKHDKVIGGSLNTAISFTMKVTATGENTVLSHIIHLVESAQNSKAPIQSVADRISSYFVPAVLVLSVLTFFGWLVFAQAGLSVAILTAVSVLVIACPCALGLATPTAIMTGTGKGATLGIIYKGGEVVEKAGTIKTILLDKTGTITQGKLSVTNITPLSKISKREIIRLMASLESHSEHPIASAITSYAKKNGIELFGSKTITALPGRGISGKINKRTYYVGNMIFISSVISSLKNSYDYTDLVKSGGTIIFLATEEQVLGVVEVSDILYNNAAKAISWLKKLRIQIALLTGDNSVTANIIAERVGISKVHAELLPQDKQTIVNSYKELNKTVAMAGDGINDAPALASADVGIAIGSGSDIAIETGEIITLRDDPLTIPLAIDLSRETMKKIKENLFFALFYNAVGIPVAMGLFRSWDISLKPELAGLAMAFSSVSVVGNALLLQLYKPGSSNIILRLIPGLFFIVFTGLFFQFSKM